MSPRLTAILVRCLLGLAAVSFVAIGTPTEVTAQPAKKMKKKKAKKKAKVKAKKKAKRKLRRKKATKAVRKARRRHARRVIRRTRRLAGLAVRAVRKGGEAKDELRKGVVLQRSARRALRRGHYLAARNLSLRARTHFRAAVQANKATFTPSPEEQEVLKDLPEETTAPEEIQDEPVEAEVEEAFTEEAEEATDADTEVLLKDDFGTDDETPEEADAAGDDAEIPASEEEDPVAE